ncbi:serine/threonine kinase [Xylona heveae TC161]|uniref:Serine/threonine kinase n=1 Tax=Xylona heveae (strain CBS 132557 / TC161) TaxID=1328760 RepID=A0A164ZL38_XYLHT|nr:serine/threonine kinase [Xylona heveae TC161]KZF19230.1 serine/threonine kinase [Xylona heveae TC161]
MEVYDQSEAFIEKDGDLEFSHTKVVLRAEDRFFYGSSQRRLLPGSTFDLPPSELTEIPLDKIWPRVNSKLTEAPKPLPPGCYVKQPRLIEYGDTEASQNPGAQLLHEANICEILKESPHPNIAQYLGCIIEDERLRGLCFANYPKNLFQAVEEDASTLDIEKCINGIENGIQHLHGLGLVHNDINPSNIMIDGDIPVIIDFDSCKSEGAPLGVKGGTTGWSSRDTKFAECENDIDALSKIRNFLKTVFKNN